MSRAIPVVAVVIFACWGVRSQETDHSPSFEVASIKPSRPMDRTGPPPMTGCWGGPGNGDPGLYTCRYASIQGLVIEAFELKGFQMPYVASRDRLAYDIDARVPSGTSREQFTLMKQNLLAERFKLAFHYEKKDTETYELTIAAGGLKMREAQPAPTADPAEGTSDQAPSPNRIERDEYGMVLPPATYKGTEMTYYPGMVRWVARAATMGQIAGILSNALGGPVTDSTGLTGKYDFILHFSRASLGLPEVAAPGEAGGPGGELPTLYSAIQRDLGIKLGHKKGAIDLFVIDHVEKVPTEN